MVEIFLSRAIVVRFLSDRAKYLTLESTMIGFTLKSLNYTLLLDQLHE